MAKRSSLTLAELAASLAGARKAPLPVRVKVALAQPASTAPTGEHWLHEIKLDGYRMVCRRDGRNVQFLSRNHQDWTKRLGALGKTAAQLKCESALLDGEVVATLPDGRTSFDALQNELSNPRSQKLIYYAFDLLHLDGFDLTRVRLDERKNLLQSLISESRVARLVYCDHILGDGQHVLEHAARMGVEGIVSKRRDHPYRTGRSSSWQKVKCIQSDDFIVGGYTTPTKAEYRVGAILLGQLDQQGRLVYAGRVGTGFSDWTRQLLADEFQKRAVTDSPFVELPPDEGGKDVRFVEPSLIAHVEYLERCGKHNVLRQAVFRGLRDDISTSEVLTTRTTKPIRKVPAIEVPSLPKGIETLPDIRFTHPEKLMYSSEGITKLDLARHYAQVAEWMLPHICNRPLSLVRCPEGIDGPTFFQKRPPPGLASYVRRVQVPSSDGAKTGLAISNMAGLLSLVQIYALELHVCGARVDRLDRPDRIVFDLDPDEAVTWQRVKDAALELREILTQCDLKTFVLATGGKGLHLVVPINRRINWEQTKAFSFGVAKQLAGRHPRDFTTNVSREARLGKIYIDYMRNRQGATAIAPYSTRARPGAPVAVPLVWEELGTLPSPATYSVHNLPYRLSSLKQCPWSDINEIRQTVTRCCDI